VGAAFTPEQKRSICSTFASVLRASKLRGAIDPEVFYGQLTRDFDSLVRGDGLVLDPLWSAMTAMHRPHDLYGLFFKFEETGTAIGLRVTLPTSLLRLSKSARTTYLEEFNRQPRPSDVPPPMGPSEWQDSPLTPLPMAADLDAALAAQAQARTPNARLISPENRHAIAQALTWAIKESPAGPKINSGQLAHTVMSNFEALCDGRSFRFRPLLKTFFDQAAVRDEDVFVALTRFKAYLATANLQMEELELDVDPATKARLLQELESGTDLSALYPTAHPSAKPRKKSGPESDVNKAVRDWVEADDRSQERLKELGLEAPSARRANTWRVAALALALAVSALFAYFGQPVRSIDVSSYREVFPIAEASWTQGTFYGEIDDDKWLALDPQQRKVAVERLEALLRRDGRLAQVAIADRTRKLVVYSVAGERLHASASFMARSKR